MAEDEGVDWEELDADADAGGEVEQVPDEIDIESHR